MNILNSYLYNIEGVRSQSIFSQFGTFRLENSFEQYLPFYIHQLLTTYVASDRNISCPKNNQTMCPTDVSLILIR